MRKNILKLRNLFGKLLKFRLNLIALHAGQTSQLHLNNCRRLFVRQRKTFAEP